MGEIIFPVWFLNFFNFSVMICANLLLHSTLILTVGLCFARAFKKQGAAIQSLILRVLLLAVFISPLVSILLELHDVNSLKINIPSASINERLTVKNTENSSASIINGLPFNINTEKGVETAVNKSQLILSDSNEYHNFLKHLLDVSRIRSFLYSIFIILWAASSLFFLGKLAFYHFRIFCICRTARDADISTLKQSRDIVSQLNIDNPVILKSSLIKSPFLTGLFKPVILLPEGIKTTREILLHELAHLVRRDTLWNLLSYLGIALLPLQPLMRILCRQIEDTSDYVCDDYVIKHSNNSLEYAKQLCNLAEHFQPVRAEIATGVGIVSNKSSLRVRVERIIEDSRLIYVSAKKNVAVYIVLICLGITVLSGFVGFRGKNIQDKTFVPVSQFRENFPVAPAVHTTSAALSVTPEKAEAIQNYSRSIVDEEPSPESTSISADLEKIEYTAFIDDEEQGDEEDISELNDVAKSMYIPATPATIEKIDLRSSTTIAGNQTVAQDISSEPEHNGITGTVIQDFVNDLNNVAECKKAGNKFLKSGKYAMAEHVFLKALQFKSKDPEIYNLLGKAYFGKREYTLAIMFFQNAINLKPDYADAHYNLGDVFFENGDLEGSMKHYKTAIQLNPAMAKRKRPMYLGTAVRRVYK